MDKILFVNACVRSDSRTCELARCVLEHLSGTVEQLDLNRERIPVLDREQLKERDRLLAQQHLDAPMLRYAAQFAQADTIVIAAPCWDLMFPALLKIYLEAVTVTGVTFHYTESGQPATLCRAKRLIYVTTAGDSIGSFDFGFQYVKTLAENFYGIPDVRCFRFEGLDIIGADVPAILQSAKEQIARTLH